GGDAGRRRPLPGRAARRHARSARRRAAEYYRVRAVRFVASGSVVNGSGRVSAPRGSVTLEREPYFPSTGMEEVVNARVAGAKLPGWWIALPCPGSLPPGRQLDLVIPSRRSQRTEKAFLSIFIRLNPVRNPTDLEAFMAQGGFGSALDKPV